MNLADYAGQIVDADLRTPPHSVEAEQSVLGGLLLDNSALDRALPMFRTEFFEARHAEIFGAISALIRSGEVADVITVFERLKHQGLDADTGGMSYLNALAQSVPSAANMRAYAEIVRDKSALRHLLAAADIAQEAAYEAPNAKRAFEQAQEALAYASTYATPGRSLVRQLAHVVAEGLTEDDEQFDDELVEGTLGRSTMAVLYGDSNSGKTFAAIDLGAAICRGVPWLGRACEPGLVVYLATEAAASVELRLRAYQRHHGVRVPGFVVVQSPVNLFQSDADVNAVVALVTELEKKHGSKAVLIIGDTLARISAGANENSGEDMGIVLKHSDLIRSATGATFLWIHHTGKDQAKGMRGWSGTRAAIDTEIEVTVDEATGVRSAEITKQRDLPGKGERIGFRLEVINLGVNRWGKPRGSCVVVAADAPVKSSRGKRPSEIAGAITEFLRGRAGCLKGGVVKHFADVYPRQSVYREINKLLDGGMLIEAAGVVALPGSPGVNA